MTFPAIEASRAKGKPVDLFLVQWGPSPLNIYAFTNAEQPVSYENVTYQPTPIERDAIKTNGSLDNATTNIRTRHDNPLATLFRTYPPSYPVNLRIFKGHLDGAGGVFQEIWNGRLLGASEEGYEVSFTGQTAATQRQRPGLRRNYQFGCPHVLYGQGQGKCNANKAAATTQVVVSAISGSTLVLPTGWPVGDPARYNMGLVEWTRPNGNREERMILSLVGGKDVVLDGPPTDLLPGSTVDVIYGCPHTYDGCLHIHGNQLNYGGCLRIPSGNNPLGPRNNFY